jgi:uncharacterized OB-fold protein
MPQLPPAIAERLFLADSEGSIVLLGGRDRESGRIVFPVPDDAERFDIVELPRTGTLWSWTVQRFLPKSPPYAGPDGFEPYAVGYVELGEVIIVEARLTGVAFDALHIGMPMRVVAETFMLGNGEPRLTYAFAPVGETR